MRLTLPETSLRAGTPGDLAVFSGRAGRGLLMLALLAGGSGGAMLVAQAAGLLVGAGPEAGWLLSCGLIAGGLSAVAAGLSRAAAAIVPPIAAEAPIPVCDAFVTLHARTGETLAVERAPEGMAGLTADGLLGPGLFERIQVADRPAFLSALSACAADGRARRADLRLRCGALGELPRFVALEARIAGDAQGAARVQWQEPADAGRAADTGEGDARARAERANDAKSRFLRTMSHELRTPLNSILGFSEMLTGDAGDMDAARRADYARIIHESGQHLLGLVNGILDLSRVEAGAYDLACEDLDIHGIVAGAVEMMALEADRRGVHLASTLPAHLPPLTADQRAVRQVFLNLLSNAVKFTPAGGEVVVDASVSGGMMHLKVRDTGAGMRAADVERLGEPFFQAGDMDQRRAGIGLGLAVVRALVELHRGVFQVASVLGVGTTVTVALPLCGPEGVAATPLRPVLPLSEAGMDDRRSA
ncbi:MAG: HAMP domain-containing sensor histidine kinase [Pseudomonadota bacterium]